MFGFIKNLFGGTDNSQMTEAIKNGATLIDVRSQEEFSMGSVKGAVNIPLDNLTGQIKKLKKDKTIIVFCASGIRSSQAKNILNRNGFEDVINGGGWRNVQSVVENK
ncbi:rhodanese-like domain-containing protein [Flavobacterium sp.]|uniref:rhodanese-like domain-containing protein n=1 Tax=Flavobacterium sp. TaxID=239 RepID=UPI00260DF535|nr:rhodanese-like domain-containing protein [Flavobacterium sp.]MDD3005567.1 rhodanese-like domain-containing protein [Flavobacterium sp.]